MSSVSKLAWLAGLLEGEGSFLSSIKPGTDGVRRWNTHIALIMTDKDVVQKVATLFSSSVRGPYKYTKERKPFYSTSISGRKAIGWMLTLFTFLGKRRQAKVAKIVKEFRRSKNHIGVLTTHKRHRLLEGVM